MLTTTAITRKATSVQAEGHALEAALEGRMRAIHDAIMAGIATIVIRVLYAVAP
jgi:hypothetical protein